MNLHIAGFPACCGCSQMAHLFLSYPFEVLPWTPYLHFDSSCDFKHLLCISSKVCVQNTDLCPQIYVHIGTIYPLETKWMPRVLRIRSMLSPLCVVIVDTQNERLPTHESQKSHKSVTYTKLCMLFLIFLFLIEEANVLSCAFVTSLF